jgi:hypothetical protein
MKALAIFLVLLCPIITCFPQDSSKFQWIGEVHSGWQATMNEYPYTAQIKAGLENKAYDTSIHYSAFFRNQVPIQVMFGLNNRKGLQILFSATYFTMRMALSNPPDIAGGENYHFGQAHLLSLRVHGLIDYNTLFGQTNKGMVHFMSGISAGETIPYYVKLSNSTAEHFGIESFQCHTDWTLGIDFMVNIDLSKHLYIANTVNATIPIAGNLGNIQMQSGSSYQSGKPVSISNFSLFSGLGWRF